MTNTNQMTYNPLDNDDIRNMIFSYLRVPCEYKKPPHYYCMKPYCIMVEHEDNYYLNPLLCMMKQECDGWDLSEWYDTDGWESLGDVIQHFRYMEDSDVYQVEEMRDNLHYYREQKLSDVVTYV